MIRNIDAKFKKPYNNCNLRKIIYHQYLPMFISIFNLRGAQTDRFRYEVFQNLFFSPMNTGFLRDTVATVPTVYGIETWIYGSIFSWLPSLQQYLPFTVLKLDDILYMYLSLLGKLQQYLPFTVLKPYVDNLVALPIFNSCNSTYRLRYWNNSITWIVSINLLAVATVPTVYGIETCVSGDHTTSFI